MKKEYEMSPLISAEELLEIKHHSNIKIFDVRGKWKGSPSEAFDSYKDSHIDGAVFLDWNQHFVKQGVPIHLAPAADAQMASSSFEELGISDGDTVVLYDDYHHMLAGRMWWAMRYNGFLNVKILNGGWANWKLKGFPVSSKVELPSKGSFQSSQNDKLRVSMSQLIEIKDHINLIDGRGAKGYKGTKDDPRSGHIPGAINVSHKDLLNDDGLFKSANEILSLFKHKFQDFQGKGLVSSCGAGYSGTVPLIALKVIGIDAPLFDDSFSVWRLDESRPVERG